MHNFRLSLLIQFLVKFGRYKIGIYPTNPLIQQAAVSGGASKVYIYLLNLYTSIHVLS